MKKILIIAAALVAAVSCKTYENFDCYEEFLLVSGKNGLKGICTADKKEVLPIEYDDITYLHSEWFISNSFMWCLARESTPDSPLSPTLCTVYRCSDTHLLEVFSAPDAEIVETIDGTYVVAVWTDGSKSLYKAGGADLYGPCIFDRLYPSYYAFAYSLGDSYGVLGTTTNEIFPPEYADVQIICFTSPSGFMEDRYFVRKDGIDRYEVFTRMKNRLGYVTADQLNTLRQYDDGGDFSNICCFYLTVDDLPEDLRTYCIRQFRLN